MDQEEAYADKLGLMMMARMSFEQTRSRESISRALRQRLRPTKGPFSAGDRCYFWRQKKVAGVKGGGVNKYGGWKGPATVIGAVGTSYYLDYFSRLIKAAPEFMRHTVAGEEIP